LNKFVAGNEINEDVIDQIKMHINKLAIFYESLVLSPFKGIQILHP
jgi:hypothetical protein